MSEDSPFLPEDTSQQATPLDLLLNAITGTGENYPYPQPSDGVGEELEGLGGFLEANRELDMQQSGSSRKHARDETLDSPRRKKIAKTVNDHIILTAQRGIADTENLFSTIEVWHPRTGQKSYGKERRILNPPPTLRVKGPLLAQLTTATLHCSTLPTSSTTPSLRLSSQTHHIPLMPQDRPYTNPIYTKKGERADQMRKMRESALLTGFGASLPWERSRMIAREREALTDGLTFPGLWIGEEVKKGKEFQLELEVGPPGIEISHNFEGLTILNRQRGQQTSEPLMNLHQPQLQILDGSMESSNLTSTDLSVMVDEDHGQFVVDTDVHPFDQHLAVDNSDANHNDPIDDAVPTTVEPSTWSTFVSAPLSIVSKPSQKTAKARSMASCLTERDSIALTMRINSQTVRTKYMKLETGETPRLTSRTGKWSPFRLEVINRAIPPLSTSRDTNKADRIGLEETPDILTYGSVVVIIGMQDGTRSEPVRLVKVEKNEMILGEDVGQPVSELQRVGFVRLDSDLNVWGNGERWYLSAPGARAGGGELLEPREMEVKYKSIPDNPVPAGSSDIDLPRTDNLVPETLGDVDNVENVQPNNQDTSKDPEVVSGNQTPYTIKKRRKTPRNALALASLAEDKENATNTLLSWQRAESTNKQVVVGDAKSRRTIDATVDSVPDWMCWVITGVSCFIYSFFNGTKEDQPVPTASLDTVPRILAEPAFYPDSNTLDILISDFSPDGPLDVYIGSIGPLHLSTWRSTVPPGQPKHVLSQFPAIRLDGGEDTVKGRRIMSSWPSSQRHTLLVIEIPPVAEIIKAMQDIASKARQNKNSAEEEDAAGNHAEAIDEAMGDTSWLTNHEEDQLNSTGDLTIQQALKSVEDVINEGLGFGNLPEGNTTIDPALQQGEPEQAPTSEQQEEVKISETNQTIGLTAPSMEDNERSRSELVALPLLLIRREDGVGFGAGCNLAAVKQHEEGEWGLRVVPV